MTGDILLMVLFLLLILAGAYFATRLFGRMAQRGVLLGGRSGFRPGAYITLIDRLAVDKEHSVLLIRAGGEYYLIGMGEQVTLLEKLGKPPEPSEREEVGAAFKTVLDAWRDRGKHEE